MREHRLIPLTPISSRYLALRNASQQQRLAEARRLVDHPEELADEFAASVAAFSEYANIEDHFYPQRRRHEPEPELRRTIDVALRLEALRHIAPGEANDRRTAHDTAPSVTAVPAARLAAEYVDRELLVQRTTSPGAWSDGSRNVGGLRLDLLLVDGADRTPIVAEVKLPGDTDPFFAIVQALACAAHLVTRNQYERMRRHFPGARFPEPASHARVDLWLLLVDSADRIADRPSRGRFMADLEATAETLASRLLEQDGVSASIRRMAGVGLKRDAEGTVRSEVRWAWTR